MRRALVPALAALAILSPRPGHADGPLKYDVTTLPNGLKVYLLEDHSTPTVTVVTWYGVGSADERPGRTGFAHLFEHLMFKGSAHIPDGRMDVLLEGAGGWTNAFTSGDMTVYQDVASANFLETVLWGEGDRLAGLTDTLDQGKLDNQRDVVRNERRQSYENRPYGMASIILAENLWPKGHGYHWPTIGYHEDLLAASVNDVKAFFKTWYLPNNATVVIAGDFKPAEAKALAAKYLGWIPKGPDPERPKVEKPAPITKTVSVTTTDKVQVPKVFIEWRGPATYTPDDAPLGIAAEILGGGKSSRLYQRLVYQDRIAQDAGADFEGELRGGTFEIVVTAKPGVSGEKLLAVVQEELAKLQTAPVTEAELEQAKNSREAAFLGGLETLVRRAELLAQYDVQAHDPDYFDKDLQRYRNVSAADVQRVAKQYLEAHSNVILTINPEAK